MRVALAATLLASPLTRARNASRATGPGAGSARASRGEPPLHGVRVQPRGPRPETRSTMRQAAAAAFAEADRIDRLMSHYLPRQPPLPRQPRGRPSPGRESTKSSSGSLALCLRYSRESEGAFDVTVGPLMRAWGFFLGGEPAFPGRTRSRPCAAGWATPTSSSTRSGERSGLPRSGVELDLGGIAKGYAIERMAGILRRHPCFGGPDELGREHALRDRRPSGCFRPGK